MIFRYLQVIEIKTVDLFWQSCFLLSQLLVYACVTQILPFLV